VKKGHEICDQLIVIPKTATHIPNRLVTPLSSDAVIIPILILLAFQARETLIYVIN